MGKFIEGAASTGNILLCVKSVTAGSFGIAVMTEAGQEEYPIKLDVYLDSLDPDDPYWYEGYIEEIGTTADLVTGAVWFSFEVTNGSKYTVYWDDSYSSGSGNYDGDVCVAAKYQGDTSITIFGMGPASQNGSSSSNRGVDTGYSDIDRPNSTFTANRNGVVLLRVLGETVGPHARQGGSFGITFMEWTDVTRPIPRYGFVR